MREKEQRLTHYQKELEKAGRECQRLNRVKADLLVEQGKHARTISGPEHLTFTEDDSPLKTSLLPGRLQLEADRHAQNIKKRDTQVEERKKIPTLLVVTGRNALFSHCGGSHPTEVVNNCCK